MPRGFALICGIAFNRLVVLPLLPLVIMRVQAGAVPDDERAIAPAVAAPSGFPSWTVPLLFAEWWIEYRKPRRRRRPAATRPGGCARGPGGPRSRLRTTNPDGTLERPRPASSLIREGFRSPR